MSNKKFSERINGKGYYIALILCATAIGISGYLYYRNTQQDEPQLQNPSASATDPVSSQQEDTVPAIATQPQQTAPVQTQPNATETTAPAKMTTAAPVSGTVIADYSMDALSYNQTTRDWRTHNGIDYGAEAGTAVCAAADGTVYTVYEDDTMGTVVVIRHADGYTTQYASLAADVQVAPGDSVTAGQTIGCVGQTALLESAIGDHVHFSVSCDGTPIDPEEFLSME